MAKKRAAVEDSEPEVESEQSEEVDADCSGDDYDPEEDMKENRPKSSSKSQTKSGEKTVWDALTGKAGKTPSAKTPKSTSKSTSDTAVKLRRNLATVLKSQMVYKKSLKRELGTRKQGRAGLVGFFSEEEEKLHLPEGTVSSNHSILQAIHSDLAT